MIARIAALSAAALLSLHMSQTLKNRRENPCRRCHYPAFHDGERLVLETQGGLAFATPADAARYEEDYARPFGVTGDPPAR